MLSIECYLQYLESSTLFDKSIKTFLYFELNPNDPVKNL